MQMKKKMMKFVVALLCSVNSLFVSMGSGDKQLVRDSIKLCV